MSEDPFAGLSEEIIELKTIKDPKGKSIKIKPKPKDVAAVFLMRKETEESLQKATRIIVNMLQRTYTESKAEDLEAFVAKNFAAFIEELSIVFGFVTRDVIEKEKKKALEELKKQRSQ